MRRLVRLDDRFDLGLTLGPLQHGAGDPTTRVASGVAWRAVRTSAGPASVRYERVGAGVEVQAWGEGAEAALEQAPAVLGCDDEPRAWTPAHPLLRELHRQFAGMRMTKTGAVFAALLPAIIEQKVTGREAFGSWRRFAGRYGEPAPGPARLKLHPAPERIAAVPYFQMHTLGIERRRADVLRRACARAGRVEEAGRMDAEAARRRLRALPGIGVWTAAEVTRVSHGDPDAISVGDFHIKNIVAWALAGEPRADDERMLELLEPEAGNRARAVRLLEAAGITPPKFGPRHRVRSIERI